jgi:arylsulfatase A-like enzyme
MMFVRRTIPTIPTVPTFTAILRFAALLACVLQTSAAAQTQDTVAAPNIPAPNILVIVVDDLGWAGVGFHAPVMPTPNLDRLAKEGTELGRFYAYPVCSPTRAALLTGQMPRRFGIVNPLNGQDRGVPAGEVTLPSVLHDAGYTTALVGKWHLGTASSPQKAGFDHFYGFLSASTDYFKHTAKNGRLDWQRDGKSVEEEGYSTYLLADEAVRQIKARDAKKPFYIQLCFNAPHDPLAAPAELVEKRGLYKAVVEAMDIGIGRVLDAVDAEKLRENTLVVFLSDNGAGGAEGGSNAPMRGGKGSVYEGGIHVPAVVRWTGKIAAGAHLAQPMCVQDLLPTLAEVAGAKIPEAAKLDGASQWAAISSGKVVEREPFVIASFDNAVYDGAWKLILFEGATRVLFNLAIDPSERNDVAKDNPEIVARLSAKAEAVTKDLPAITAKRNTPVKQGGKQGGRVRSPQNAQ